MPSRRRATLRGSAPGSPDLLLPLSDPEKNQVPRIDLGLRNLASGTPTWERGPDGEEVHHRAIFDAKGGLVVLALHNSDDSDGWKREGEDTGYFHTFAEGMAYPLAINVLFYVMTH